MALATTNQAGNMDLWLTSGSYPTTYSTAPLQSSTTEFNFTTPRFTLPSAEILTSGVSSAGGGQLLAASASQLRVYAAAKADGAPPALLQTIALNASPRRIASSDLDNDRAGDLFLLTTAALGILACTTPGFESLPVWFTA